MKLENFVPPNSQPSNDYEKDLDRILNRFFTNVRKILNAGLLFIDNFDAFEVTITTSTTPGSEIPVAHPLKRVPSGFLVLSKNKAAHVFDGPSGKDAANYFIQSDVASVKATILIV